MTLYFFLIFKKLSDCQNLVHCTQNDSTKMAEQEVK